MAHSAASIADTPAWTVPLALDPELPVVEGLGGAPPAGFVSVALVEIAVAMKLSQAAIVADGKVYVDCVAPWPM